MKIVVLDAATLGADIDTSIFAELGELTVYNMTSPQELCERVCGADVLILNKIHIGRTELEYAKNLKLICVTATGFDNIDVNACRSCGVAVANVQAYSTESVAQVTAAMVLSLANHITEFDKHTKSGAYHAEGVHNCLTPVFHELNGKTWGVVGLGNIGKKVAQIAQVFGCRVIAYKRTPEDGYECVGIDELCKRADIITIHTPLNDGTRGLFNAERFALMKKNAVVVNAARGAVVDDEAAADAILSGKIAGFGTDVYVKEPIAEENPLNRLKDCDNVILTPHMAWGAYEARVRCINEIKKNIQAFINGERRNRVD